MPTDEIVEGIRKAVGESAVAIAGLLEWKENVNKRLDTFVSKTEFTVVRSIVFALAGVTLATVLAAVLSKVLIK